MDSITDLSSRVLAWFDVEGRKDLPWQQHPTPYRVWIAEIMLQQTQVNTVIPYYQRFIERFPQLAILATASIDEVLHYWTGLGYYARARNLHRAAQQVNTEHAGKIPDNLEELMHLPGIGRSTAGAILSLAYHQRHPILDGNVKRILCRYHAIEGWTGATHITRQLWQFALQHLPTTRFADYTQAMMDLGATLCKPTQPHCHRCPLQIDCIAHLKGLENTLPTPKPRKVLPVKATMFIMLQNQSSAILLEKRPPRGIWGGLWSFPEAASLIAAQAWCQHHYHQVFPYQTWQPIRHTFTHFHLDITPIHIHLINIQTCHNIANTFWYNLHQPQAFGLAAPVARLLTQLVNNTGESIS